MKKAALPLYTMLVIACLVCFQADDNLNVLNLSAYVSGKQIGNVDEQTIIVAPGAPKIFSCYRLVKSSAYSPVTAPGYNCCNVAVGNIAEMP